MSNNRNADPGDRSDNDLYDPSWQKHQDAMFLAQLSFEAKKEKDYEKNT